MNQTQNNTTHHKNPDFTPFSIFVSNLPYSVTAADLVSLCSSFGTVKSSNIVCDQMHRSRGFGFVQFGGNDEVLKAVRYLDGMLYKNRRLVVQPALKEPRQKQREAR